ncbi:hypothetical protein EDD18DRAFT_1035502, partial [Armillaria luteobubalina]
YPLRIKNLEFQVVWVGLPDVEALALSNTYRSSSYWSIPIIQDPSTGAVVSEFAAIAEYLDKTYPTSEVTLLIPAGTKVLQLVFGEA